MAGKRASRGAALLLVLWLIALLTAVVGAFALIARIEYMQGRVLSHGVVADQAARAGLEYAMTRVVDLDQTRQWLPDGREYPCEVVDISLSGAAVKVEVMPAVGTNLLLGKMRGRVVRYLESGIAIEFVKPLDRQQLNDQVR